MKRLMAACALLYLNAAPAQGTPPDWLIVAHQRIGPITATTSEAMLKTLFGKENVEPVVLTGEGFSEPGDAVYPHKPTEVMDTHPLSSLSYTNNRHLPMFNPFWLAKMEVDRS